jgi:hypothetical protein
MNEDELARLHDDLISGKSRRGKLGGIGSGSKHSLLLDGPKKAPSFGDPSKVPNRPLYDRFVLSEKKELSRHLVVSTLKANGGQMRWNDLVMLLAEDIGEPLSLEFKYRVLSNIPEAFLCSQSPIVRATHID